MISMFKRVLQVFKRKSPEKDLLNKKKSEVKEWLTNHGFNWHEFENIFFWKVPFVSFAIYLLFTGLFWKLVSYRLQKISLLLIIISSSCLIEEVRKIIWESLQTRGAVAIKEKRKLGFEFDDLCSFLAAWWISAEKLFFYLLEIKNKELPKFCLHIVCYISVLLIILVYIPVAEILFGFGTIAYFYPVINYLGLVDFLFEKIAQFVHPIYLHLSNSRTKRRRNQKLQNQKTHISSKRQSFCDSDDETFIPNNELSEETVDRAHISQYGLSRDSSYDEFELQHQLHHLDEVEHSSDFDDNEFLPINPKVLQQDFPSISQFDSMLEPRDDEFYHGLNFSDNTLSSQQDLVDDYFNETDNEVEELPEEVKSPETNRFSMQKEDDFEFLDHADLNYVTDEEINKQNSGSLNPKIVQGISSMLGY